MGKKSIFLFFVKMIYFLGISVVMLTTAGAQQKAAGLGHPITDAREIFSVAFRSSSAFDYGDPTPAEQLHLEAINRARINPHQEAARLGIDLFEGVPQGKISGESAQPLTFNALLLDATRGHSQDMIDQDYFSHYSLDGRSSFDRMQDAGYIYNLAGENIAFTGSTAPMDEAVASLQLHDNLFVDENYPSRGHRVNMLNPQYKEVGTGLAYGAYTTNGQVYNHSFMVTCNFGASNAQSNPFVLGVVYEDRDGDVFYDPGEGVGDVALELLESENKTMTASAGGYALLTPSGSYTVEATLADGRKNRKNILVQDENVKVDFLLGEFESGDSNNNDTNDSKCSIISPKEYSLTIPCADYSIAGIPDYLRVTLEYAGPHVNGNLSWALKDITPSLEIENSSCAVISSDLTITVPCAELGELSLWLELKYQGQDSLGRFIWTLNKYGINDETSPSLLF